MRDGNFDPGPMPKMDWLPVDKLTADARFQRSIESRRSQSNIKNIVERFTWSLFQVATVANVDGTFSIIDGQHRVEAARQIGLETVPCIVIEVENVAEAARLFVDANRNRVTLTPQAIHKALVAAGDEQACAVDRAASAAGIEILPYPIQGVHMRPGQTLAVGTIRNLVREVGEATATEVLQSFPVAGPTPAVSGRSASRPSPSPLSGTIWHPCKRHCPCPVPGSASSVISTASTFRACRAGGGSPMALPTKSTAASRNSERRAPPPTTRTTTVARCLPSPSGGAASATRFSRRATRAR